MTAATQLIPPATGELLPIPDRYRLRKDRCVVEVSVRALRVPLSRARFAPVGGEFTVAAPGSPEDAWFTLDLNARSVRGGLPSMGRYLRGKRVLHAAKYPVITFAADGFEPGPGDLLELDGSLTVRQTTVPLSLKGTIHHADRERVVVWLRGTVRARPLPAWTPRLVRLALRRPLHVEVAAEFLR